MRRFAVVTTIALLSFAATTRADWLNRVLQTTGGSIAGFQGTENFFSPVSAGTLDANVDFAVFAPGSFSGTFNPFPGYPGFNPSEYVYAYQVYNNGEDRGGQGTVAVSQIALELSQNGLVSSLGHDPNFDPSNDDVGATLAYDFSNSAVYLFVAPELGVSEFSEVLLLSSPFAPVYVNANVVDGGGTAMGTLPAPVPEPTTGLLCVFGLAMLRRIRRS